VPAPGEANVNWPGLALAAATSSFTEPTGIDGCTDST
jgi:hypothetical protein